MLVIRGMAWHEAIGGRAYSDGKLQVTGDDTGLFVIPSSVTSQFEDLSSQVLQDSGEVNYTVWKMEVHHQQEVDGYQQGILGWTDQEHQLTLAGRSCPFGAVCEYDRQGIGALPWTNGTGLRPSHHRLCLLCLQTCLMIWVGWVGFGVSWVWVEWVC